MNQKYYQEDRTPELDDLANDIGSDAEADKTISNLIESLSAMIEEKMGEWYGTSYNYCPPRLSTLAQIRDAIEEFNASA